MRVSAFDLFSQRSTRDDVIALDVGDSYLKPPAPARHIDLEAADLYRLGAVEGSAPLRGSVKQRLAAVNRFPVDDGEVVVVPGGTAGVSLATEAVFEAGDEVVVITPAWPAIFGILERLGVVIREVPIGADAWPPDDAASFRARLRAVVTDRTAGVYVCDPDNPCGFVFPSGYTEAIADLALEHSLWLICDVAYADLIFPGHEAAYAPLCTDRRLTDRCLTVGSFTKTFALAGLRIGYLLVPMALVPLVLRLQAHVTLHASTVAQEMALACLRADESRVIRESYRRGAALVREHLNIPVRFPQAGAFVFLDLRQLGVSAHQETMGFLADCLDHGVALCPGKAFGAEFEAFARLCFTGVPEPILCEGLHRLNLALAAR